MRITKYKTTPVLMVTILFSFNLFLYGFCYGMDYYVSPTGNNLNSGKREYPFQTIQHGVNMLQAGDTLIVKPGIYQESVKLGKIIGTKEKPIIIRAQIPHTVFLQGNIPVHNWKKAPEMKHTYYAPLARYTPLVYERDTNREYKERAVPALVDDAPLSYSYDQQKGYIYLHTSDDASPDAHLIEACTLKRGFDLWFGYQKSWWDFRRKHITIEGFIISGYSKAGIHFRNADSCQVNNCIVHHCGLGIILNSSVRSSISHCEVSWCYDINDNEGGGIAFRGRGYDNIVKNCIVHDVIQNGIRHYGAGFNGCVIRNCLVYRAGYCGIQTKGVYEEAENDDKVARISPSVSKKPLLIENNVVIHKIRNPRAVFFHCWGARNNTICPPAEGMFRGGKNENMDSNLVLKHQEINDTGFVSPLNFDFRLQSNSPFKGKSVGAYPYTDEVFFIKPDGNDKADGTSIASAWMNIPTALTRIKSGDTLYILPGNYSVSGKLTLNDNTPVYIRSQGKEGEVIFNGNHKNDKALEITGQGSADIKGIRFTGYRQQAIMSGSGVSLKISRCIFDNNETAIITSGKVQAIKNVFFKNATVISSDAPENPLIVYGCIFSDNKCVFKNRQGILSNFNDFHHGNITRTVKDLSTWRSISNQDLASISCNPLLVNPKEGNFRLQKGSQCFGRGYLWSPIGSEATPFYWYSEVNNIKFKDVTVSLATPETANICWETNHSKSLPAIRYGISQDHLDQSIKRLNVQYMNGKQNLTVFNLKPSTTYYFRVGASIYSPSQSQNTDSKPSIFWDTKIYTFTTPEKYKPKCRTFYVSDKYGSDHFNGFSADKPLKSLRKVSLLAEPGDTFIFNEGVYPGILQPVNSGISEFPITFKTAENATVIISGKKLIEPRGIVLLDKKHIRIKGFIFKEQTKFLQDNLGMGAQLTICHCEDIIAEKCVFDARMYYARALTVLQSRGINIQDNAFYINHNCPGIIVSLNDGPVVFNHNSFYRAGTRYGVFSDNQEIIFTNNVIGEKISGKWKNSDFIFFHNKKLILDYNYYAFNNKNKIRYAIDFKLNPESERIAIKGKNIIQKLHQSGYEKHGKTGSLPWKNQEYIKKISRIDWRIPMKNRQFVDFNLSDFELSLNSPCQGMASNGLSPGIRISGKK